MKYLEETTVKSIIELSQACDAGINYPREFDPFDEVTIKKSFEASPERQTLSIFINNLSEGEKTELLALMWLGRNEDREWTDLVLRANDEKSDIARYLLEKQDLAKSLTKGIQRSKKLGLM